MGQLLNDLNGAIARMRYGEMHRFTFHKGTGISGMDIERILQNYGIQIWGREMNEGDEGGFIVKKAQAEWAERVMCSYGVPLTSVYINPNHRQIYEAYLFGERDRKPIAWGDGVVDRTFTGRFVSLIAHVFGYQRPVVPQRQRSQVQRNKALPKKALSKKVLSKKTQRSQVQPTMPAIPQLNAFPVIFGAIVVVVLLLSWGGVL